VDRVSGRFELYELVKKIPKGRCAGYGAMGRYLQNPVSGYVAGRWMANCDQDVPWWRVVAKDGTLVIARRDPAMGIKQRQLLEREQVPFIEDRVDMDAVRWDPFEDL
jgi:methylated-DNA-protein-cysteine methyltransferase-like protein